VLSVTVALLQLPAVAGDRPGGCFKENEEAGDWCHNGVVKVVGTRRTDASPMTDQAGLAKTAAWLRGTAALVPRGVYRFSSFEEADAWMTRMMLSTLARLSLKTSSASAAH
jgi:hypothetical protein